MEYQQLSSSYGFYFVCPPQLPFTGVAVRSYEVHDLLCGLNYKYCKDRRIWLPPIFDY